MPDTKPWEQSMPEEQFAFLRGILAAPSPIGLEGAMTHGILEPHVRGFMPDGWEVHRFKGNAGIVVDTNPKADAALTVMVIGHADKIRMQVRSIGPDGKIWINSDSFLPATLLGNETRLFVESPDAPGSHRVIEGGTIEAVGAIHFADADLRSGKSGIKAEQLYLELQLHGEDRQEQVEALGVRAGDPILLHRPIRRGVGPDTFFGAYLDNGLGCFVVAEAARLVAERGGLGKVRYLGAVASFEEIGRLGSRIFAQELRPDVVIGVDVSHDYDAAPNLADKKPPSVAMGGGFSITSGAIVSPQLNSIVKRVADEHGIPYQLGLSGRDTGTDAMAAAFASIDAAATSIGFPIRNMHTVSECGHTGDLLAAVHVLVELLFHLDREKTTPDDFRAGHPRLDRAERLQ